MVKINQKGIVLIAIYGLITVLLLANFSPITEAQGYRYVRGIIHVHSHISSGSYSIKTLSAMAQKKDISVMIITDHFLLRWEYGLFPLRNVIKRVVRKKDICSYDIKSYLEEVRSVNKLYPNMVIIAGAEVSPFYYWTGSFFRGNLTLNDWQRQFLVMGLDKVEDYKGFPLVSNGKSGYDQYHGDQGSGPYQQFIDYVLSRGGLIFWSSPEATYSKRIGKVKVQTLPYPELLLETVNYTGFASLYEGYRQVGGPGGIWDRVLREYCEGIRKKPVWTIGEIDYHFGGESNGKAINEVQTVFIIRQQLSQRTILDALKAGKMYALRRTREYELILKEFIVINEKQQIAFMGDEIVCKRTPVIKFHICSSDNKARKIKVKLIRSGEVIKIFQADSPLRVEFQDMLSDSEKRLYYRLDIETRYPHKIITNPIFVKKEETNS